MNTKPSNNCESDKPPQYQFCPSCGQTINSKNMEKHWRKVHASEPRAFENPILSKECPVCKALLAPDKYAAHVRKKHRNFNNYGHPKHSSKRWTFIPSKVKDDSSAPDERNRNAYLSEDLSRQKKLPKDNQNLSQAKKAAVICPFCRESLHHQLLEAHLERFHADDPEYNSRTREPEFQRTQGVEVTNPDLIEEIKQHVIDESGVLIDPGMLTAEEPRKTRDERWKNATPNRVSSKPEDYAPRKTFQNIGGKSKKIPGAFKGKLGSQTEKVKCPLCKHRTEYNVLFVHIQVVHPNVSAKKLMAEFNRNYKRGKPETHGEQKLDINRSPQNYESFKQSQDESRDGGKYMGHMRRENGKFGSLPLYDDYSDEADAS